MATDNQAASPITASEQLTAESAMTQSGDIAGAVYLFQAILITDETGGAAYATTEYEAVAFSTP